MPGQRGEQVLFLVLVVQRRGDVEIAQHLRRGLGQLLLVALVLLMFAHALEQLAKAQDALMAGAQQAQRVRKIRCRVARQHQYTAICGSTLRAQPSMPSARLMMLPKPRCSRYMATWRLRMPW